MSMRKMILAALACIMALSLGGCVITKPAPEPAVIPVTEAEPEEEEKPAPEEGGEEEPRPEIGFEVLDDAEKIDYGGVYTSREDVGLYLYIYGELPPNFMTKKEARALGWTGGSLEDYAPGYCIGGDYFGNNEGILPEGSYHECDIDTLYSRKGRGAKRIVYSDDGRIYYTEDHYETFVLLYGEE